MLKLYNILGRQRPHYSLCVWTAICSLFLATNALAGNVEGDFSNGYDNSTVDSNNSEEAVTNNYNATGAGSAAPVMSE